MAWCSQAVKLIQTLKTNTVLFPKPVTGEKLNTYAYDKILATLLDYFR